MINMDTEVIECFKKLQQSLYHLATVLYHDTRLPIWLAGDNQHQATRQHVYQLLNQLEYTFNQASRSTIQQPGLVGASNETLQAIKQANHAKDEFKIAIQQLKKHSSSPEQILQQTLIAISHQRHPHSQAVLRDNGLSRLHLKQCYRHIPLLLQKPEKVSWTWAHTRAIKRLSLAQAEALLLKKTNSSHIQQQLQKLRGLPTTETLAIVQELAPHLRANIITLLKQGAPQRRMISGALPIFYPETAHGKLPIVSEAGDKPQKNRFRLSRADQKLDPEIFLPSLRAHRYRA